MAESVDATDLKSVALCVWVRVPLGVLHHAHGSAGVCNPVTGFTYRDEVRVMCPTSERPGQTRPYPPSTSEKDVHSHVRFAFHGLSRKLVVGLDGVQSVWRV